MTDEKKTLSLGRQVVLDGQPARIVRFCDEPNTGLCVVEYRDHRFVLPTAFLDEVERLRELIGRLQKTIREMPITLDAETVRRVIYDEPPPDTPAGREKAAREGRRRT